MHSRKSKSSADPKARPELLTTEQCSCQHGVGEPCITTFSVGLASTQPCQAGGFGWRREEGGGLIHSSFQCSQYALEHSLHT